MSHSPEPWSVAVDPRGRIDIEYHDAKDDMQKSVTVGDSFCFPEGWPWEQAKIDYRRIVACVNACKGIPTEELESREIRLSRSAKHAPPASSLPAPSSAPSP